ncbi:MAG: hypothetical protein IPJ32_16475 [Sphingobacteriaceae bacterium]|nr:hypothetical protein [Sphingobacteriaceae bacterium]
MSYDIYFIKSKALSVDNVDNILESEVKSSDEHYISKELMISIKNSLSSQGLKFEAFEQADKNYIELNFQTYQVSMFDSQIAISVPYWDSNKNDGINKEIKLITNVLLDNGFTGYDQQTGEFITTKYQFQKSFSESKTVVDSSLKEKSESKTLTYLGIGLGLVLVVFLVWRMLK